MLLYESSPRGFLLPRRKEEFWGDALPDAERLNEVCRIHVCNRHTGAFKLSGRLAQGIPQPRRVPRRHVVAGLDVVWRLCVICRGATPFSIANIRTRRRKYDSRIQIGVRRQLHNGIALYIGQSWHVVGTYRHAASTAADYPASCGPLSGQKKSHAGGTR